MERSIQSITSKAEVCGAPVFGEYRDGKVKNELDRVNIGVVSPENLYLFQRQ